MFTKDLVLNASWYDKHKKHHTHPCFMGSMAEVLKDGCGHCPPVPADVDPTTLEYVSRKPHPALPTGATVFAAALPMVACS
jgi:hypothetical protein